MAAARAAAVAGEAAAAGNDQPAVTSASGLARQAARNTHRNLVAMPDLLLEFLSEEIPARMQARAAEDLRKIVTDRLVAAGLTYEGAKAS